MNSGFNIWLFCRQALGFVQCIRKWFSQKRNPSPLTTSLIYSVAHIMAVDSWMLRGMCVRWLGPVISLVFYTFSSRLPLPHYFVSPSECSPHARSYSSSSLLFLRVSVSNKMLSCRWHTLKKMYFTVLFSKCFTVSLIHMVHMSSVPHRSSYIFNLLLPFQRASE